MIEAKLKSALVTAGLAGGLVLAGSASAVPTLQLYINGGTYDTTTETIIAPNNPFTLTAYWSANGNVTTPSPNQFFISMAVVPSFTSPTPVPNLGSIKVDSNTINVVADMVYGTPPLESGSVTQLFDPGDLSKHGVFDTWFYQTPGFAFDTSTNVGQFDTAQCALLGGAACTPNLSKTGFSKTFNIDVSGLAEGYAIHFDLYSVKIVDCAKKKTSTACSDIDINDFAPFSHDAESDGGTDVTDVTDITDITVPEPGSISLLGVALLGFGLLSRRRFMKR